MNQSSIRARNLHATGSPGNEPPPGSRRGAIPGFNGEVHLRRWVVWFGYTVVFWAGWLLLVGNTSGAELIAGAVAAAAAAAIALEGGGFAGRAGAAPLFASARQALGLPWKILRGTIGIFGVFRHPARVRAGAAGEFVSIPSPSSSADPLGIALRALTVWYETVAPDAYVVDLEREAGLMVLHRLPRRDSSDAAPRSPGSAPGPARSPKPTSPAADSPRSHPDGDAKA